METVLSLIERQYGFSDNRNYDFALKRLYSHETDNWKGIVPSDYGADFNPEPPIFSAKFCNLKNYRHILAIANEDGKIALQDTNKINTNPLGEVSLEGQQCHFNAVFDLEWMPHHLKFISASGDNTTRLWEIRESSFELTRTFSGHTRSVKTATFRRNDPAVFATGGRDGAILIWDSRANSSVSGVMPKADNCIYSGHSGGPGTPQSLRRKTRTTPKLPSHVSSSSITGLAFQDDYTLVSCGAGDGIIKVWDLRRNYSLYKKEPQPKFSYPYPGTTTRGFTSLLIDNYGLRMYVSCMDNHIYCYNLSSFSTEPIKRYTGFKNTTFYIKSALSPDGQYLISGSSDEKAYIWNINSSEPILALTGHTVEVTCAAWSQTNDVRIVTCSDDARHKIWRISPENIELNDIIKYKGRPELIKPYPKIDFTKDLDQSQMKKFQTTPRSVRRLVEENEKTPTTEKISNKRSFNEMLLGNSSDKNIESSNIIKRPSIETKGRRLFGPFTSAACSSSSNKQLASILEENEKCSSNILGTRSKLQSIISGRLLSPLVNGSVNTIESSNVGSVSPSPSSSFLLLSPSSNSCSVTKPISTIEQNSSIYQSPTSNLPNYVIDGEAPHLNLTSPKRKLKENVDWLTKIRKQKLLSNSSNSSKYLSLNNNENHHHNNNLDESDFLSDTMLSPRVQSLKASEFSPKLSNNGTPKRRSSRSGSNSDLSNPNRRPSTESILKFFTITTPSTKTLNK